MSSTPCRLTLHSPNPCQGHQAACDPRPCRRGALQHRHQAGHELSGGEQQRLVYARALVNNPSFLLADDATGNLDPLTSRGDPSTAEDINTRGTAVIMAPHYDLIRKSNERVLQVREGKVYEVERK